jgi:hypothetical protein
MSEHEIQLHKIKQEWVNRQWSQMRGIETTDYNNDLILVHAEVEDVAKAMAAYAARWDRDVLDREVVLGAASAFVFRLQGHVWTEILHPYSGHITAPAGTYWDQYLSECLHTRVIRYCVSDTVGCVCYHHYVNGEVAEKFDAISGEENGPAPGKSSFYSKNRDVQLSQINNIWNFARQFFVDQDAYEPGIGETYFLAHRPCKPGDQVVLTNPGFILVDGGEEFVSKPKIERLDYLALRTAISS